MSITIRIRIIRRLVCAVLLLAFSVAPLQGVSFGASGPDAKAQTIACETVQHCCDDTKLACSPASACFGSSGPALLVKQDVEYTPLLSNGIGPLCHAALEGLPPTPLRRPPRALTF